MEFKPRNRRLLLKPVLKDETEEKLPIFISGESNSDTDGVMIYDVLEVAPDVTLSVRKGERVMVAANMVDVRRYKDAVVFFIQENHVECVVEE